MYHTLTHHFPNCIDEIKFPKYRNINVSYLHCVREFLLHVFQQADGHPIAWNFLQKKILYFFKRFSIAKPFCDLISVVLTFVMKLRTLLWVPVHQQNWKTCEQRPWKQEPAAVTWGGAGNSVTSSTLSFSEAFPLYSALAGDVVPCTVSTTRNPPKLRISMFLST